MQIIFNSIWLSNSKVLSIVIIRFRGTSEFVWVFYLVESLECMFLAASNTFSTKRHVHYLTGRTLNTRNYVFSAWKVHYIFWCIQHDVHLRREECAPGDDAWASRPYRDAQVLDGCQCGRYARPSTWSRKAQFGKYYRSFGRLVEWTIWRHTSSSSRCGKKTSGLNVQTWFWNWTLKVQ